MTKKKSRGGSSVYVNETSTSRTTSTPELPASGLAISDMAISSNNVSVKSNIAGNSKTSESSISTLIICRNKYAERF